MSGIFRPTPLDPVPRPELADAQVAGDPALEATVKVRVGGVAFRFWRLDDGAWTGGAAVTGPRGYELDERWLTAARVVAVEALRAAVLQRGGVAAPDETPTETIRCPECERLLCSPELVRGPRRLGVDCGPAHVVRFEDRRVLVFPPGSAPAWEP